MVHLPTVKNHEKSLYTRFIYYLRYFHFGLQVSGLFRTFEPKYKIRYSNG